MKENPDIRYKFSLGVVTTMRELTIAYLQQVIPGKEEIRIKKIRELNYSHIVTLKIHVL